MDVDEKFLPLIALAKNRAERLNLLEVENIRLACRFKVKHPKEFVLFLGYLSAWENLPYFKAEITRRSAATKRAKEEDDKQQEAMERLAKADRDGMARVNEGHPTDVARDFLAQVRPHLITTAGSFLSYTGTHYEEVEKATLRSDLSKWLDNAVSAETGNKVLVTKKTLDEMVDAVANATHQPAGKVEPPTWLEPKPDDPDPGAVLACTNGLLDVTAERLMEHTPRFFTRNGLPYEYEDPAFCLPPYEFLHFLETIWPVRDGLLPNHENLQEWFGYLLTSSIKYQKILLLMGASRAGKGVILQIIEALVGKANLASTKLKTLMGEHGTSGLLGKSVAIIPDLVLGKDSAGAVDTLLSISGADTISINRKFKDLESARLRARLVIASNHTLTLPDQSGAFANRLNPLIFTKSFEGREDITLAARIIKNELPGLLHWSLAGLRRLEKRGRFLLPAGSERTLRHIRHQAGPVTMFVQEKCLVEEGAAVSKADLWAAFELYCSGLDIPNNYTREAFGREMMRNATGFHKVEPGRASIDGRQVMAYTGIKLTDAAVAELREGEEDY